MPEMDERILVVQRDLLLPSALEGFHAGDAADYLTRIRGYGEFRPRGEVEDDPSLKQIIPYVVVRHGGRLFLFRRLERGAEARLYGLYSIGVGGHIGQSDVTGAEDILAAGLTRELHEELVIGGGWQARPVGVLNEELTPVSRVHFGLVFVVEVDQPDVTVREADRLSGHLATPDEVRAAHPLMESWSQLILDAGDPFAL